MDRMSKINKLVKGVQSKLEDIDLLADHAEVNTKVKKTLKDSRHKIGDLAAEIDSQIQGQTTMTPEDDKQLDIEGKPMKGKKAPKEKKGKKAKKGEENEPKVDDLG